MATGGWTSWLSDLSDMELSDLEEESVLDELKALELQEEDDHEEPN